MKFSTQFITTMILAGYMQAAELPFQEYMTPDQVRNYADLRDFMDPQELRALIEYDLHEKGHFARAQVAHHPAQVGKFIPFAELMSPEQLDDIRQVADILDDESLMDAVRETLGEAFPGDDAHHDQHYDHHVYHHGHGYHMDQNDYHHDGQGHVGFQDPSKITEEEFEAYLANSENFTPAAIELLFAEGKINDLTDDNQLKMIMAAVTHNEPMVFQLLVGSFQKTFNAASSQYLNDILMAITDPSRDIAFLKVVLKDCDRNLARLTGMYMHPGNSAFHQLFVDQCGAEIDPHVGKILVDVQVPKKIRESWEATDTVAKSAYTVKMVLVNASGAPDSGATLNHQVGNVQVAGFFSKPEILEAHPELHKATDVKAIQAILEPLARREHFCVIWMDFEAGKATVFRSFDTAGPGIAIIHIDESGEGIYLEGLGDLYAGKRTTWIHTEDIRPTDVIVGMSEEYVATVNQGFSHGIMQCLYMLYNLDCVENVVSDVLQLAVPTKAHQILAGIVPKHCEALKEANEEKWTEDKVSKDPVAQTITITHTEHVEEKKPSGAHVVIEHTTKKEKVGANETIVPHYEPSKEAIENWKRVELSYADDAFYDDPDVELGYFDDDI